MAGIAGRWSNRVPIVVAAALTLLASAPAVGISPVAARSASVSFDGQSGAVVLPRPGSRATLDLPGAAAADVAVHFLVRTDKVSSGPGQVAAVLLRRSATGSQYRARFQFASDGGINLDVSRLMSGQRTAIAGPVRAAGVSWTPNEDVAVAVNIRGSAPTRIEIRVWPASATAPAVPQLSASDEGADLADPGGVALRFGLPRAGNAPIRFDFSNLAVAALPSDDPGLPPVLEEPAVFVAPTGDDANPGTLEQPWRTAQMAADSAPAGSTVYFRAGTYGSFTVRKSGTPDSPTTFTAYPTETAVVDGHAAVAYTLRLTGVSYVNVTNLTVQGGFAEAHEGGGIMVENSSHVVVSGNLVRDNKAFGVRSQGSTYVTITRNEVTHNAVGIHIGYAGEGTVVSGNRVHDNDKMMVNTPDIAGDDVGAGGVAVVHTVGHVVVRDNLVWGNRALSYDYGYDGSAFEIYAAQNWEFTGNTAWDNRVAFETGTDAQRTPCSNGLFTRNVIYGPASVDVSRGIVLRCAQNGLIANNTFVGVQDFVFVLQHQVGTYGGSIEGLRIVNNVMSIGDAKAYSIDSAIPASVVFDANLVYKTGSGYLATMVGKGATRDLATFGEWTGQEVHGLSADPLFVDSADHDYRLGPNSPAIDSALLIEGVTDTYAGAGPDRGSIETTP